jgi:hypothetical protein
MRSSDEGGLMRGSMYAYAERRRSRRADQSENCAGDTAITRMAYLRTLIGGAFARR